MSEYWEEDPPGGPGGEDDDDELPSSTGGLVTLNLDPQNSSRTKVLTFEDPPTDQLEMTLAFELANTQVIQHRLIDHKVMRFMTKLASSAANATTSVREKRQMVVLVSEEFPPHTSANGSSLEFSELARTNVSIDDPSPLFELPVRVTCRKGMERMVRVQVVWSSSTFGVGNEAVLGNATERFSHLLTVTSELRPYSFRISSPGCPKGLAVVWRVPLDSLGAPNTPYVSLACKRHMSFSQPYIFRKISSGPSAEDSSPTRVRRGSKSSPTDFFRADPGVDPSADSLLLARESCVEGRFAFRLPTLIYRPLVRQLEAAIGAWKERYEAERLEQNVFISDGDAFASGRVLVRLSVVEASGLPALSDEAGSKPEYYAGLNKSRSLHVPAVASAQRQARSKPPEKGVNSHAFVAITHEKPRPQMGVLLGHTNTEYSTQNPLFGSNGGLKACPHSRPRDAFSVAGNTRLGRGPADCSPSFLFYAKRSEVGQTRLRLEVFQEAYSMQGGVTTQLCASTSLGLDPSFVKKASEMEDLNDREAWLPLVTAEGVPAGRLLVRMAVFEADARSPTPAPEPSPEAVKGCYEWMRQAGLSGRPPRECDVFASPPPPPTAEERVQIRYPLDWLRTHIDSLTKQLQLLQASVRLYEQAHSEGRGFRSSALKVTPELQGVALNVHSQTFVVADARKLAPQPRAAQPASTDLLTLDLDAPTASGSSAPPPRKFIYDLISTGAPTAHALGFRRGGLMSHQQELNACQKKMQQLDQSMRDATRGPLHPTGATGELYNDISASLLKFEAMVVRVAVRRAFVISQALSIALMSLATKLDIMLTEDADQELVRRTAQNMVSAGYLLCFQGLVSTYGKEQGMLEDVGIAMELVSQFSFELRPRSNEKRRGSAFPTAAPPSPSLDLLSGLSTPPKPPSTQPPLTPVSLDASPISRTPEVAFDVEFDEPNRRIRVLLDPAVIARLPAPLQAARTGLVVRIIAGLFAQGIDAKQSISNYANQIKPTGTSAGGNSTIQPVINRRTLRVLNEYAHRCYPREGSADRPKFDRHAERYEQGRGVSAAYGSAEEFSRSIDEMRCHPMLEALKEAVKRDNGSSKNVDLLREQERVVLELGGGQVVFCKSGKDRTGMAVTLHQARVLADRHGCAAGMDRLVHDANVMRLHGTRLVICEKNVGHLKYAFNHLQLQFMPGEYRPPGESVQDILNSFLNRDMT